MIEWIEIVIDSWTSLGINAFDLMILKLAYFTLLVPEEILLNYPWIIKFTLQAKSNEIHELQIVRKPMMESAAIVIDGSLLIDEFMGRTN